LAELAVLEISLLAEQVLLDQFTLELLAAEQESQVLEVLALGLQAEQADLAGAEAVRQALALAVEEEMGLSIFTTKNYNNLLNLDFRGIV
jgi:hypothetical protein